MQPYKCTLCHKREKTVKSLKNHEQVKIEIWLIKENIMLVRYVQYVYEFLSCLPKDYTCAWVFKVIKKKISWYQNPS